MRVKPFRHPDLWIGGAALLLLTLPFAFSNLDVTLASWFFHRGWPVGEHWFWQALYHYGTLPGLCCGAAGLVILLGQKLWPRLAAWKRPAAVLALTLALGPGLLVNTLGKGYWGRPRPREIKAFGGTESFRRIISPGTPGQGKSFPSGHPSMGYLFCAFFFIDQARRRRWAWLGGGLAYGTLMGIGRMAQGAHFASDVLWSGGLTYLSAAVAHHVILPAPVSGPAGPETGQPPASRRQKILSSALLLLGLTGLALAFLLATPFFQEWKASAPGRPGLTAVRLRLTPGAEIIHILPARQKPALLVAARLHGFGFPGLRLAGRLHTSVVGTTLAGRAELKLHGLATEQRGEIQYRFRQDLTLELEAENLNTDLRIGETATPGRYADLKANSRQGGLLLHLAAGSRITGRVRLVTRQGDVNLSLQEITDPGPQVWEIGTDRGTVLVRASQATTPARPLNLRAWSRWGDVAMIGKIGRACGLNLEWNEGDGRSGLQANGRWAQDTGSHLSGPSGMAFPYFNFYLATSNGLLGIQLDELGSGLSEPKPTVTATPLPAAWELPAGAGAPQVQASDADAEPAAAAEDEDELEWVESDLIVPWQQLIDHFPPTPTMEPAATPAVRK